MQRRLYETLAAPLGPILGSRNIAFTTREKSGATWYHFEKCPLCGHKGPQCGIREEEQGSRRVHAVKCFHPADSSLGEKVGYAQFLSLIGVISQSEVDSLKRDTPPDRSPWRERLIIRLAASVPALEYLRQRGLTDETIRHFRLGLSTPYKGKDGKTSVDALVVPIFGPDGAADKANAFYAIPGVTQNPIDKNGWMKGPAKTYWGNRRKDQKTMIIVEGMKDAWILIQELRHAGLDERFIVITSTHGTSIPEEWRDSLWWSSWETIYAAQDADPAGDSLARTLATIAGRKVHRLRVPDDKRKDWTDFFLKGGTIEELMELTVTAPVIDPIQASEAIDRAPSSPLPRIGGEARYAYDPVDIKGDFVAGYLYYPFRTLLAQNNAIVDPATGSVTEQIVWKREVQVVRSDGSIHTVVRRPAPKGTPDFQRVFGLSDGTLLPGDVLPSDNASWSFLGIQSFIAGRVADRRLPEIATEIRSILKRTIWLPYPDDYTLLTLTVIATYLVPLFDAVPLLIAVGPKGSGKSGLAEVLSKLSYNGSVLGAVSAATIARQIDQDRGFVALDDLESVGARTKDGSFNDLIQALKVSYKKATALKAWTDVKTMRVERLNFYGIKLITNTLGADGILGSRMFRIQTRLAPEDARKTLKPVSFYGDRLQELRDCLHIWAFRHCRQAAATYDAVFPHRSDRHEEIAAPLRVFAAMIGSEDPSFSLELESALARQHSEPITDTDPVEVFLEAVKRLVSSGFRELSVTHVAMEMRTLFDPGAGQDLESSIPPFLRPEWVGMQLRSHDIIDRQKARRTRLFGHNLRINPVKKDFVEQVQLEFARLGQTFREDQIEATAFCSGCATCAYRNHGCSISEGRLSHEVISQKKNLGPPPRN